MENTDQKTEMTEKEETVAADATQAENMAENKTQEPATATAEVDKLKNDLAEQKDKYLRLYSEFENFRRRTAKEKLEMIQSANEQLIKSILPIADDFERAEKSVTDKTQKDLEGFLLIYNKFRKTLDQYGVKNMEVQQGSEFNADLHEAITQIPAPDDSLKGKVVDVVEKGYLLNDKVIRFAKVVVGS